MDVIPKLSGMTLRFFLQVKVQNVYFNTMKSLIWRYSIYIITEGDEENEIPWRKIFFFNKSVIFWTIGCIYKTLERFGGHF